MRPLLLTLITSLAAAAPAAAQTTPLPEVDISPGGAPTAQRSTFTGTGWVPGAPVYVHLRVRDTTRFVRTVRLSTAAAADGSFTARARPFRGLGNRGSRWVAQFDQQPRPSRATRPAVVHSFILREAAPTVGLRERYVLTTRGRLRP